MKSLSVLVRLVIVSRSIFSNQGLTNLWRLAVAALFFVSVAAAHAGIYTVTRFDDTSVATLQTGGGFGPGVTLGGYDLRGAMFAAMAEGGPSTIHFSCSSAPCTVVLQAPLPPIYQPTVNQAPYTGTFSLTIDGGTEGNVVIDGNSGGGQANRVFFVDNVPVTLKNLVIQNATAQGGAGGPGQDSGAGGGAGFGGGLFVNQTGAVVNVINTAFLDCVVVGGSAGSTAGGAGGGGGGLGYTGGTGYNSFNAGGGGGVSGYGGNGYSPGGNGGNNNAGGSGGSGGGGGGYSVNGGQGVASSGYASNSGGAGANSTGGLAGFGGGGGGGAMVAAGNGGFGGGGGSSKNGNAGNGGFGGGGGGSKTVAGTSATAVGGVQGGSGVVTAGLGGGGGGAAAGAAIFVVNGTVVLTNVTGANFSATPGVGSNGGGSGTANAASVFNYGGTVNGSGTVGPLDAIAPISVAVGQTSGTLTATATFTTAGTPGAINVLTQGAVGKDFKVVSGGTCALSTSYAVGASCTVLYSFTPSRPGLRTGAVSLSSNASTPVVLGTVFLSGVGTAPLVTFPGTTSVTTIGSGFNGATAVAVDGNGNVFVADDGNNAIKEVAASGGAVTTIATVSQPNAVVVDGAGNLYVANWNGGSVYEIPAVNGVVKAGTTPVEILHGVFTRPFQLALDASGDLFVSNRSNPAAVYEVANVNGVLATSATVVGSGFGDATGVAVDVNGNVFEADGAQANVYEVVAQNGVVNASSSVVQIGSGNAPNGIAVDAAGDVYFSTYNSSLLTEIVAANGVVSTSSVTRTIGSGLNGPAGVTLDGSGHVFVANYNNSVVNEIDMTAAPAVNFATATTDGTTDTTDGTQTVTVANAGNAMLYFAIPASGTNPTTAADFTFTTTGSRACPSLTTSASAQGILAAGGSCAVPLTFTPGTSANGAVSESLVFSDTSLNNSSATQAVTLTGMGIAVPTTALQIVGPTAVYVGTPQTFTVKAVDAAGAADGTYRGTVMLTSTDGSAQGVPVSYTFTSGDAGVHAFTVTFNAAGNWKVTAADAADSLSVTSSAVSVASSSYLVTTLTDDATATAANCVQGANGTGGANSNCSLRDAVAAANAVGATGPTGPVVSFLGSLGSVTAPGIYNVATGGTIVISGTMTINGPGANELTVEGGTAALTSVNARVFQVNAGVVTFSGLTVANGGGGQGAGINEAASSLLTVNGCEFTGNYASGAGGAIYATGTLAVGNSTFSNNGAHGGFGGAIYGSGAVNVVNSTFTNNQDPYGFGGAIYSSGAINVSNSTFSGNGAVQGGAVLAQGTATVSNSIFTGDSSGSGSGIYGYGGTVTNVVYNGDTFSGVTVTNSVSGDPMLAPLGNYGGPTQTMLPLIGSVAICGNRTGSSASADQRGVATSPFRYGQSNCYDVGAVETNYGLSFTLQPTDVAVNVAMSPAPQLTMTENGTVFTLASESLLVSDRANTLTPFAVSTNSGIATLSGLVFPSAVTDKLNVSLQVRQSLATLYIASQQFQVLTAVTPSLQIAGPTTALVGVAQTFTVTVVDQLGNVIPSYTGNVMLSSTDGSAVIRPASYTFTSADAGVKTFRVTFLTAGSQTVTATDAANSLSVTSAAVAVTTPSYLVTTLADDAGTASLCVQGATDATGGNGACSLRDAVAATNAYTAGQPVISFMNGLATAASPQVETLNSAIVINQNVAITGPGANALSLSGNNSARMFTVYGKTVSISGLTMTKGQDSSGSGGDIFTSNGVGTLTLTNDAFTASSATAYGGALYIDQGAVVISGSTFSGNTAGSEGGAINEGNAAASLTITNSTFSGNSATNDSGAIRTYSGSLNLTNVTMANNTSGIGGAIYASAGKGVTITNSIIAGNTASGSYADYDGDTPTTNKGVFANGSSGTSTINPKLTPLGNYGGTTQTMVPEPGSAAFCAGSADGVATDQRGAAINPTRYGNNPCYDAGSVQDEYAVSFLVQPSDVAVNAVMSPSPQVLVTENGLPFTVAPVSIFVYAPPVLVSGSTTESTSNGVATFGGLTFQSFSTPARATFEVLLQLGGVAGAQTFSNQFYVLAAVTPSLRITGPTTAFAGVAQNFTVSVVDQEGNVIPSYTGTVTLSSTDGSASFNPASYTFTSADAGVHAFSVTFNAAGSWTVTAADAADSLSVTSSAVSVNATSFLVTTLTDDATATAANCVQGATGTGGGNANCSLRDAVAAANAVGATGTAGPVIGFLSTLGSVSTPGVYDVSTGGVISISHSMKMSGLGQTMLTVRGGTTALTVTNAQIFNMSGGTVTISGMTLANGGGDGYNNDGSGGGAIEMTGGTLSVANSTLTGNTNAAGYGGAISENAVSLAVTGSTFTNNSLGDNGQGGAILAFDALTVSNSTFTGNSVGSQGRGGAIAAFGALTVSNSTFSNNTMGGGDGHGGAIVVSGTLAVRNTTFSGNGEASNSGGPGFGGAIEADGAATVTNSTFSGNRVNGNGGAIFGGSPLIVSDSIFTSDSAGGGGSAIDGGPGSTATNVVYNNETFNSITLTNSVNGDPKLTVLGNYGGTTQTMLPTPGSAAICAMTTAPGVATDQRGVAISGARYGHPRCYDVGAVQTEYALGFTTAPSNVQAGSAMSPAPVVTLVEDGSNYVAAMVSVTDADNALTTTPANATVSSPNGQASFSSLVFNTAETGDALSATVSLNSVVSVSVTATSGTFDVTAIPNFAGLTVSGYKSPAIITEGSTITVTAVDQYGHACPGFTGTVMLSSSDGNATYSPSSYPYTASDYGTHTFFVSLNTLGTQQSITATSGVVSGSQTGIVVDDAIWVLSSSGGLIQLNAGGTSVATATPFSNVGVKGGIAMDHAGTIWSVGISNTTVVSTTSTGGTGISTTGGGVSGPTSVAVDGAGYIWVANGTGNTVSEFNNAGATQSMSGLAAAAGLSAPSAIVIDKTGGVWVANKTGSSVAHIFGGGKPVVTPLSTATTNGTLGIEP